MKQLEVELNEIIAELTGEQISVTLDRPQAEHGDYATNVAMQLTKKLGVSPREIAEVIVARLAQLSYTASVAGPGFINVSIDSKRLFDDLNEQVAEIKSHSGLHFESAELSYGDNETGEGKTVVVEYPSPNMAKPYSVGHIRAANQGWAMRNLMLASGYAVITDNHLGDYGTPFGKWALGYETYSSPEQLEKDGIYELARVYIAITADLKSEEQSLNPEVTDATDFSELEAGQAENATNNRQKDKVSGPLADNVQEWLIKLAAKDPQALEYSQKFGKISLDHMHHVLGRLGIYTEHEMGESVFVDRGLELVDELLQKGLARVGEKNAVVMDLDSQGIKTPLMIRKGNGAALYATSDLATFEYRVKNWSPVKILHHVGAEQEFYFRQLFSAYKIMGYEGVESVHVSHGIIDQMSEEGTREKMSSRKGVILLEELLDKAEQKAAEVTEGRDVSPEDVKKIALGAVKFTDFTSDRRTNILFDWDKIFSLKGFSGPYVQYAGVRVKKILRDSEAGPEQMQPASTYDWTSEKQVILLLLDYPKTVQQATEAYEPHRIAQFVYNLASELNRYYENTPILKPEVDEATKSSRLYLLTLVLQTFEHALGILGIEVPESM
jgi:arginyl-tRNA synthetase